MGEIVRILKISFERAMENHPEIKDISEKKGRKHTDKRKKGKHLVCWRNCLQVREIISPGIIWS